MTSFWNHSLVVRIKRSMVKQPSLSDAVEAGAGLAVLSLFAVGVGFYGGLLRWDPLEGPEIAGLALRAFFVPALGEEVLFRAAMVPSVRESPRPIIWIAVSTVAFTIWHLVETLFLSGAAAIFLRADFLALAAGLGLICAVLRYRSGSIWTAVGVHWAFVVGWQGWFGGPSQISLG